MCDPDGTCVRTLEDGTTQVSDRDGNTTHYFYDAESRLTKIADPTRSERNEAALVCGTAGTTCFLYQNAPPHPRPPALGAGIPWRGPYIRRQ